MAASIPSSTVSRGSSAGAGDGRGDVALQAQLTRCERQLGDWEACPSSKTPEGRKIIENLRARIVTLQSRMTGTATADAPSPAASNNAASSDGRVGNQNNQASGFATTVGSLLSVFA